MTQWPKYVQTRFPDLGYAQCGRNLWRFVALDDPARRDSPPVIGHHYRTKAELLGDLERYGRQYCGEDS